MKKLIQNTLNSRNIQFFCDIHGNSSNMNIFMNSYSILTGPDKLIERVFPLLYSQSEENFNYNQCDFNFQNIDNNSTALIMTNEFDIQNSFILQCSFCGPTQGKYKNCHFNPNIFKSMARKL